MSQLNDNYGEIIGLLISGSILCVGIIAPSSPAISQEIQLVIAVFAATIVLWIAKPIPYTVSSILCVVLLYVLGIVNSFANAVSGFASNLVFFLILLLLIGKSIAKVGLDEWVARQIITADSTPKGSVRRLTSSILLLAYIMPSGMARTVTFIPVIDQINDMYGIEQDSQFRQLSYYVIGHLNPVASLALMTGGGMSLAAAGLINTLVQPITWVDWALYMTPPVIVLFGLSFGVASIIYDVDKESQISNQQISKNSPEKETCKNTERDEPPEFANDQKLVGGLLLTAVVLWVVGSFIGIPTILPAMILVLVLSLPGIQIITSEDVRTISWELIFLIGAMLSLIDVMHETNAFDVIINLYAPSIPEQTPILVVLFFLFMFSAAVRAMFSSIAASFIILLPILLEFVRVIDLNTLYLSFGLAMILMSTTFLPFNNPTILVAYERGPLTKKQVFMLGMITLFVCFIVVLVSWTLYWPTLDRVL